MLSQKFSPAPPAAPSAGGGCARLSRGIYEADTIFFRCGDRGITRYTTANGKALISDDTQMTLFTADGLFAAERRYRCPTAAQYIGCIHENYLNWLVTQDKTFRLPEGVARSPLLDCGALYARRAPGGTCLSALESGYCGTFDRKLNRSKGCGGVMRVAPVAVRFAHQRVSAQDVARLAAQAAAVTHGHPLGYIPAAFLAGLILRILRGEELRGAVQRARHDLFANFDDDADLRTFLERIDAAVALADDGTIADDLDAIRALGAGWVAEETVAIALYCVLRHAAFEDAIVAAVNHDGDSDSTGAVAGNIMGALTGLTGIGEAFLAPLELKDLLYATALRLAQ